MLERSIYSGVDVQTTWTLVANRERAVFFVSEGGKKTLRKIKTVGLPVSGFASRSPEVGLQQFAKSLAELLNAAYATRQFYGLTLVAEPHLLDELRPLLSNSVSDATRASYETEVMSFDEPVLRHRIEELGSAQQQLPI